MKGNLTMKDHLLLDGGTGTLLMAAGMPQGVCVEAWVLEHPAVLQALQREYVAAGSQILLTPTFGANRTRLKQFGLQDRVAQMNQALAALTAETAKNAPHTVLVAGDVSPTGLFCKPWGDADFEDIVAIYTQQIAALKAGGAQLVFAETMMSLGDVRAAAVAARDCGLPVIVSVTVDENGRTLSGMPCEAAVVALQAVGAAAVGLNCSTGPADMAALLPRLARYARVPLLTKPNAGTPSDPLSPDAFAAAAADLVGEAVLLVGGCCQSTPAHIAALAKELQARGHAPLDAGSWLQGLADPQKKTARTDGLPLCFENKIFDRTAGTAPLALTEPLPCDEDLEDTLYDLDADGANAVLVQLKAGDDVTLLATAAMASPLPLVLQTEDTPTLAAALRSFCGRVGAVCRDDEQRALAMHWGAREV